MSEKKSSTNNVEKGTDKLADMLLMDNKSSTKDVDKGTDEFSDMKEAVKTIHQKGLYQFEDQSNGYKGWFKLDIGFFETTFLNVIHNSIKKWVKIIFNIKTWNCIKRLLYRLI